MKLTNHLYMGMKLVLVFAFVPVGIFILWAQFDPSFGPFDAPSIRYAFIVLGTVYMLGGILMTIGAIGRWRDYMQGKMASLDAGPCPEKEGE